MKYELSSEEYTDFLLFKDMGENVFKKKIVEAREEERKAHEDARQALRIAEENRKYYKDLQEAIRSLIVSHYGKKINKRDIEEIYLNS